MLIDTIEPGIDIEYCQVSPGITGCCIEPGAIAVSKRPRYCRMTVKYVIYPANLAGVGCRLALCLVGCFQKIRDRVARPKVKTLRLDVQCSCGILERGNVFAPVAPAICMRKSDIAPCRRRDSQRQGTARELAGKLSLAFRRKCQKPAAAMFRDKIC